MSISLLVTGATFSPEFIDLLLKKGYEVDFRPQFLSEKALINAIRNKDAYILGGLEYASARVIKAARRLKIIAVVAVGYQSYVDEKAATKRGIAITNTPNANARATAEMTLALMLAMRRKLAFVNRLTKAGSWREDIISSNLQGNTLGILGMGSIGGLVAEIARKGFGMKILYYTRTPKPKVERRTGARFVQLGELLAESDVVSLHLPLTRETEGMFKTRQFETMKRSAILINTARPQIVSPKALLGALKKGLIAGCAMDGYYIEPSPPLEDDPYHLLNLSDEIFLISPHLGYHTTESINHMCELSVQSVVSVLEGRKWPYIVNPQYIRYAKKSLNAAKLGNRVGT